MDPPSSATLPWKILEMEPAGPFKLFDVPVETHSTIVLHKAERGDALLCSSIFSTIGTNGSIGASEQPGHWSSPPVTHRLGSPPTVPRSWCWQSLRACRSRLASGSEWSPCGTVGSLETGSEFLPKEMDGNMITGHFRILNWRYLPYIRPIFQAYVREYPQKIWPEIWY